MLHSVVLILGSNIDTERNLKVALDHLTKICHIEKLSSVYETHAFEGSDPDFLNAAVSLTTNSDFDEFKYQKLRKIEEHMGRVRVENKNAPRTIDLDILIFDGKVIDPNIWSRVYLAKPLADILPSLRKTKAARPIKTIADLLVKKNYIKERSEISLKTHF